MRTEYGVPVPQGVRKDWDVSSCDRETSGVLLRKYHADPTWGDPQRCVAWFDRFERLRTCVGHFANGRAVIVRIDANGRWSTTFSRVPASAMSAFGQDAEERLEAKPASAAPKEDAQ